MYRKGLMTSPVMFNAPTITKYVRYNTTFTLDNPIRSWFFPKQTEKGLIYGANSRADVIILDMEDAVSMERKSTVRKLYLESIEDGLFRKKRLFVRINDIDDYDEMLRDISQLSVPGVSGFLVPKVENTRTLQYVDKVVTEHERKTKIRLVPIIETASGYKNAFEIASYSNRNVGLIFGNHDFSADCMTNTESFTDNALATRVLIAARCACIEPISGACVLVDPTSSNQFFRTMKKCGFTGSVTLNETQVIQANREFSSPATELRWAQKVAENIECSTYQDTVQDIVQVVGPPHRKKANQILQKHSLLKSMGAHTQKTSSRNPCDHLLGRQAMHGLQVEVTIGETMLSNYETTINEAWKTKWQSSFLTSSRLFTSDYFASQIDLPSTPISFMLLKTLALSLSVSKFSESARVHLGCYNARQHTPVYHGDTVTAHCRITDARQVLKKSGDDESIRYTIVDTLHTLLNHNNEIVFTVEKKTMFSPLTINKISENLQEMNSVLDEPWKDVILSKVLNHHQQKFKHPQHHLWSLCNDSLKDGELILHTDHKVFGRSETLTLCKLLKITNGHHRNFVRYSPAEILVPGPLVIAAMISNSERETGDVIYEEIPVSMNINKVHIGDQISTISYVESVSDYPGSAGQLEQVTLIQIGVKDVDLEELYDVGIPKSLFKNVVGRLPKEFEECCAESCPLLFKKIACIAKRVIIRMK